VEEGSREESGGSGWGIANGFHLAVVALHDAAFGRGRIGRASDLMACLFLGVVICPNYAHGVSSKRILRVPATEYV
jgi:hypothetical protein